MLLLSAAKVAVHYFGFEFLDLNGLLTSGIGGAVFIVGFLLSSILQDYKEAEKIPADLRNSIEAIEGDLACFAQTNDAFDLRKARLLLLALIDRLREGLGHKNVPPALDELAKLTPILGRLEGMGMAANFVVRLRTNQDVIRRALLRIYTIQRVEFVPSVHVLVQTLVFSIVLLLLLLKTEGDPASALLFGFITFMFVYVLYLVRRRTTKFAAIPMPSSRPRIGVSLASSSRAGGTFLWPFLCPRPSRSLSIKASNKSRAFRRSKASLVCAKQARSPSIASMEFLRSAGIFSASL